jgi:hypothetical protein
MKNSPCPQDSERVAGRYRTKYGPFFNLEISTFAFNIGTPFGFEKAFPLYFASRVDA